MAAVNDSIKVDISQKEAALQNEITRLKKYLATLWKVHADETCQLKEKLNTRKPLQDSQEGQVQQLNEQLLQAEQEIYDQKGSIDNLKSENQKLQHRIKELEKEVEHCKKQLQHDGKLCDKNCVRLAIHWVVCDKILNYICCSEQLGNIIIRHGVGEGKIEESDMQCDQFMNVLLYCRIVDFEPLDINKIEDAWSKLKDGVHFLALKIPSRTGHVVVCDINNGVKVFRDPAAPLANQQSRVMSQDDFVKYLKGSDGIGLFTVNFNVLEGLVDLHRDILHITTETHHNFGTTPQGE